MKNIHVLPTDKPSRLHTTSKGKLVLLNISIGSKGHTQNIYITNSEEIKRYGEYYLDIDTNEVKTSFKNMEKYLSNEKKIILTTDQDLIKDGVQAIDDEFLEWFVKNPSCESIEVESGLFFYAEGEDRRYKIIIPKEEPKQETLNK
jgi:predicted lipase